MKGTKLTGNETILDVFGMNELFTTIDIEDQYVKAHAALRGKLKIPKAVEKCREHLRIADLVAGTCNWEHPNNKAALSVMDALNDYRRFIEKQISSFGY